MSGGRGGLFKGAGGTRCSNTHEGADLPRCSNAAASSHSAMAFYEKVKDIWYDHLTSVFSEDDIEIEHRAPSSLGIVCPVPKPQTTLRLHCYSPPTPFCIWMHLVNGMGNSPSPGQPTPGVVKQDKSSGGSVDTTKTRSGPQRVRMSSGERPMDVAKGKQSDTEALCHPPPPMREQHPWSEEESVLFPSNFRILVLLSQGGEG